MDVHGFNNRIKEVTNPLPGSYADSFAYRLTVKKKYEGFDILSFFKACLPQINRQVWVEKIQTGNLKVNDEKTGINYVVSAGDVTTHTSEPKVEPPINADIELLYLDNDILAINKPSPLPVHPSGRFIRNTLLTILKLAYPDEDFKITHRIDANTTGIIVIARTKQAADNIRRQFEERHIDKKYLALVEGIVEKDELTLQQPVGSEVLVAGRRRLDLLGKMAHTKANVLGRLPKKDYSLLELIPTTGRTNQIRLHLAQLNHPIVGDIGHKDENYFKNNPFTYQEDSLFLHARTIQMLHPVTGKKMTFEAPIPNKFKPFCLNQA